MVAITSIEDILTFYELGLLQLMWIWNAEGTSFKLVDKLEEQRLAAM